MSLATHLETLQQRHSALEKELNEARRTPASTDKEMLELKRRKLQLKDEMERLRADGI